MNTVFPNGNGYGYGFWVDKDNGYNAEGRGTQRLHIDSIHQAIVVVTAGGLKDEEKERIGELIGHALFNQLSKINKYLIDFKTGDKGNEVAIKEDTHHINEVFPVSIAN